MPSRVRKLIRRELTLTLPRRITICSRSPGEAAVRTRASTSPRMRIGTTTRPTRRPLSTTSSPGTASATGSRAWGAAAARPDSALEPVERTPVPRTKARCTGVATAAACAPLQRFAEHHPVLLDAPRRASSEDWRPRGSSRGARPARKRPRCPGAAARAAQAAAASCAIRVPRRAGGNGRGCPRMGDGLGGGLRLPFQLPLSAAQWTT